MMLVACEYRPGPGTILGSVAVRDVENVRTFLSIDRSMVHHERGQTFLPVGVVHQDRERGVALIEFPEEADSGAHRIWVPLTSLRPVNGTTA